MRRLAPLLALAAALGGCRSPESHRLQADRIASEIIENKQQEAFGRTEPFTIERPADTFRRRLLEAQGLPVVGPESFGTDRLERPEEWPEDYPKLTEPPAAPWEIQDPYSLSLMEALQIGARNSRTYQAEKEAVFVAALDLDLQRNNFRWIADGTADASVTGNLAPGGADGVEAGTDLGVTRLLKTGALVAGSIGVDLVKLLTGSGSSALGFFGDLSIAIPLLRGSSRFVVTEPLTQAERNVIYALRDFERFKRTFAVQVASEYFGTLRQLDSVRNAEENYRSLAILARRTRAWAAAGRLPGVDMDQARQDELNARDSWIAAMQSYRNSLDRFKTTLGLPPDARIELKREELDRMAEVVREVFPEAEARGAGGIETGEVPPADAKVELVPPDTVNRGRYELDEPEAIGIALESRQDVMVSRGRVYDAQRAVIVAADALRAGLTLEGTASFGESRGLGSADLPDGTLDLTRGVYSAAALLDLPLERTAERNAYRESYIELEQSVRNLQALEDEIKAAVRATLRQMLQARESVRIQLEAARLARDRVTSTNLFLEAGRTQVRDVLDAQESLLDAQNALTEAFVNYRIAELELQRDLGVLEVGADGLWKERTFDANP